ncbi:MAG: dockerin type I repeat-containing protein [Planctomycetota bacterium]
MKGRRVAVGFFGAAQVVLFSTAASAYVNSIEISPPHPRPGQRVVVAVEGDFPDGCWSLAGREVAVSGGRIEIRVLGEHSGGGCPDVLVPYRVSVDLGSLAVGAYEVVASDPQESKAAAFEVAGPPLVCFPGDANGDAQVDVSDAVFTLLYLFSGGSKPGCERQADANGDEKVDLADPVYLLNHLFRGGSPLRGWRGCYRAEHCVLGDWLIFCMGHWECDCGECRAVCEFETCGDGYCDVAGGESEASCPRDCKAPPCRPVCGAIGSRSEGWYDSCTGKLIRWDFCGLCEPVCRHCGSKSEGWYDSCTGELIQWADCDCAEE